jgi:hypothetical protein
MKASELRIGNHIQCLDDILTVEYLDKLLVKGNYHRDAVWNTSVQLKHCKPIPLTEEWLLKFGYVKFKSNEIYNEWGLIIDGVLKYKIIETVNYLKNNSKFTMPNSDKPIMIQYVHQLQNLYFALTEEELICE